MVPLWTRTRLIPTIACCIFFVWVNFNASPFGWRNVLSVFRGSIWESLVNDSKSIPVTVLKNFLILDFAGWVHITYHRGVWQVIANFALPILKNPVQLSLKNHFNPILTNHPILLLYTFILIMWRLRRYPKNIS